MRHFRSLLLGAASALAFGVLASAAHAELTLVSPENFGGTGLGKVSTILTIQSPGNSTTETGSVSYDGKKDSITGDAKTGNSQTQTRTLGSLGITSAATLRVVFNASEPGSDPSIDLTALTLTIYNTAGGALFSAPLDRSYLDIATFQGTGNSGYVFALNSAEASQAQTSVFGLAGFDDFRVGLSATAENATGGVETFFVANSGTQPPVDTPEPASLALLGAGLLGVWGAGKSAQKRA